MTSMKVERTGNGRAPIAAVTGARRGIGRAVAEALADAGFDIVLIDIEQDEAAAEVLAAIHAGGHRARMVVGDIADVDSSDRLAAQVFAAFGTLDCLVNNAGVVPPIRGVDLLSVTHASFDRVMGVNLRGTFFLTQAIARRMVSEDASGRPVPRSIITITSGAVGRPSMDWPEYAFSKTCLSLMSQAFALRLAPHGVRTYEIRPGVTKTDMSRDVWDSYDALIEAGRLPLGRMGLPEDIGRTVAVFATGQFAHTTGDFIHVDGGLHIPASQARPRRNAT
jgi:NAD(P)-dependent dehydrogenase (short-subunit alcohol dehydrogenase family)